VRYQERKEFAYDPQLNALADVRVALALFDEYCTRYSARPLPRAFEVERSPGAIDPLWHVPVGPLTTFSREFDLPAINQFQKPDWRLTKLGIVHQRRDTFWVSNLALQRLDYFPLRGDMVHWSGYTYVVLNVVVPPEAYWGQTGVWTGLTLECVVPADGDAVQGYPQATMVPAQRSSLVPS
jgi:hypothetical protein